MTHVLLSCSPFFVAEALNELRRSHPHVQLVEAVAPGHLLLSTPYPFEALAAAWQDRLPIYLHHLFPVQTIIQFQPTQDLFAQLAPSLHALSDANTTLQMGISDNVSSNAVSELHKKVANCYKNTLGALLPTQRVLSILLTERKACLGVSWASQNLSRYPCGQIPIAEPVANRAGYKLVEALTAFQIYLRRGNRALDLGASPGAWTMVLRERGLQVTAVAPTTLYPELMTVPEITFHQMEAEEFLKQCTNTFDIIVNDMKLDAQDSAYLMVEYAQHLRSEGVAIMTLKLRDANRPRVMDHAFRILRKQYKIIRVRQLISNKREVTLFLRRKA